MSLAAGTPGASGNTGRSLSCQGRVDALADARPRHGAVVVGYRRVMSDSGPGTAHPGTIRAGGRTARTARAVHEAVRELVAEHGREGVLMHAVAARSGVHEATIYRRWRDVDTLLIDVEVAALEAEDAIADSGDLRTDLCRWAEKTAASLSRPGGIAIFNAVASAVERSRRAEAGWQERRAARYIAERGAQVELALDRARKRGENPPEASTVLDRVLAPLYLRAAFGYRPASEDIGTLVDNALGKWEPSPRITPPLSAGRLVSSCRRFRHAWRRTHPRG
jgi:AcrR family transcriptional regulator